MEQRLSLVTLGVADLQKALDFYQKLGWKRANENADVVFFQLNGVILALWSRASLADDAGLPPAGSGFRGVGLAYNTRSRAEVDAVLQQAKAAGAKIPKPAADTPWGGHSGYFTDPDGHLWEVAWNPDWAIDADGNIRMR